MEKWLLEVNDRTHENVIRKSKETVEKPQEKINQLKCTVCGKIYKSAGWLKRHKESLNHKQLKYKFHFT